MSDRITDVWGSRTPYAPGSLWPVRVDSLLAEGVAEQDVQAWVQSACLLCSNRCGLDIAGRDGQMVGVRGRSDDAVNHGRLGPKGLLAGWQGAANPDRLTRPLVREGGELVETDWETAMSRIVDASRSLLRDKGPLRHAFYTSGQLFLEEYYALGIIGKAGIGTPHMDGNTRLCTATAAAALKESVGSDGVNAQYAFALDRVAASGHSVVREPLASPASPGPDRCKPEASGMAVSPRPFEGVDAAGCTPPWGCAPTTSVAPVKGPGPQVCVDRNSANQLAVLFLPVMAP